MLSTYTSEYRRSLLLDYISFHLGAFLINKPSLGLTNTPTETEIFNRINLSMKDAAIDEVLAVNGYKRSFISIPFVLDDDVTISSSFQISSSFTAVTNDIGPFTHICYARGLEIINATTANGNNRGNLKGTLIKVEPLEFAPLILKPGTTLNHSTTFTVSTTFLK